jgi:hypothetical protein
MQLVAASTKFGKLIHKYISKKSQKNMCMYVYKISSTKNFSKHFIQKVKTIKQSNKDNQRRTKTNTHTYVLLGQVPQADEPFATATDK